MDVRGPGASTALLGLASVAAAALGAVATMSSLRWHTTYAAISTPMLLLDAAAGVCLLLAGVLLAWARPADARGPLLLLCGGAWACQSWVGWQGGPDLVRTVGVVGAASLLPLVLDVVSCGNALPRRLPWALPWLYAATTGLAAARLAFAHPRDDPTCWQNCTADSFFAVDWPAGAVVGHFVALLLGAGMGLGVVSSGATAILRSSASARRLICPVLVPAIAFGLAEATKAALILLGATETPVDIRFRALHAVSALALASLGVGFMIIVFRARRAQRLTALLARRLAVSSDTSVAELLGRAMGDPTVNISYHVGDDDVWVDRFGAVTPLAQPGAGRSVFHVMRGGRVIAVVSHDSTTAGDLDLAAALGPAARLAVENESLTAQQLARLRDLVSSQQRIVATADAERRRLERNLHDAAQVSILAGTAAIHRALAAAAADSESRGHRLLLRAAEEVQATMDELRRLAHGIHPTVLELEGLAPALETLADHVPARVEVSVTFPGRLPEELERATYALAAEAIRESVERGEDDLHICVRRREGSVEVDVEGTAQQPGHALTDRAGALRGDVVQAGSTLQVRLPCE